MTTTTDYSLNPIFDNYQESDDEIIERLRFRFGVLEDMTKAVKKGNIRSLIVSGPPGVGKSFGVEKVLDSHNIYALLSDNPTLKKYEILKGSMTALGLYTKLYEFSGENNVLVLDDIDAIFSDIDALNLLKTVLDTNQVRRVSWISDSRLLKSEGIPKTFDFHGGVIMITNYNFKVIKSEKMKPHLRALESRSHVIDLSINSDREKLLRIAQLIKDGMLDGYNFDQSTVDAILQYVFDNSHKLTELSLRTIVKLADLVNGFPSKWKGYADVTILQ